MFARERKAGTLQQRTIDTGSPVERSVLLFQLWLALGSDFDVQVPDANGQSPRSYSRLVPQEHII